MPPEPSQILPLPPSPTRGRWVTILVVVVGVAALTTLSILKLNSPPPFGFKTCFLDANGLRAGANVSLAGVDVGKVTSVKAQSTEPDCPALLTMELQTAYKLQVPQDAVALTAAQFLGPTSITIDVSRASGPPLAVGGRLPSEETGKITPATIDRLSKAVELIKQLSDEEKKTHVSSTQAATGGGPVKKQPASATK